MVAPYQAQAKLIQSKRRPNLVIDLSDCNVSIKKCTLFSLCKHLESSLQGFDKTQNMILKGINKDRKKEYWFFLFYNSIEDKKKARIHVKNWLFTAFLQENI